MVNTAKALRDISAYKRDHDLSVQEISELNTIVAILEFEPDIEGKKLARSIWNYIEKRQDFLSDDVVCLLEDIASNVSEFGIWSIGEEK